MNIFDRISPVLISNEVCLYADTKSLWRKIVHTRYSDLCEMKAAFDWNDTVVGFYSSPVSYKAFVNRLGEYETTARCRHFWCFPDEDGPTVGQIRLFQPDANIDVLEIGLFTLKSHRRKGYASKGAELLSDSVLQNTSYQVCARTDRNNIVCALTLQKAGFREIDYSLPPVNTQESCENLGFVKPRDPRHVHWPLPKL